MHVQSFAPRSPNHPQLDEYSDPDLLEFAAMRGEDLDEEEVVLVEEAFVELHRRHARPLFKLLHHSGEGRLYKGLEGENALKSLVDDTFLRACDRAETYDPNKGAVLTWLVQIAKNLIKDRLEAEARRVENRDKAELEPEELERVASLTLHQVRGGVEPDPEQIRLIRDALAEAITEREWKLLTQYLAIQVQGKSDGRADRGAVAQLAEMLKTTPQNLRATKSRALKKIKAYVRERLPD